ncbi:metallophosphoesterase [Kitasatospora sp. DSM 101779]|uniref:metallophosphoesterase family protein n=1 Tax=Kitasatospora sp. DSM 101779 TaxID=2853165 RepID=UPI0021D82379|nr:metallophosphoesterase [Kitasatospora sp. DSM 101779]
MSGRTARIAAIGDIHLAPDAAGRYRPAFQRLGGVADLLLLAGDLTRHGTVAEARTVAAEVAGLDVPVIAVLGNHDHHDGCPDQVADVLREEGAVTVLEGSSAVVPVGGMQVGVAGTKGFGGGFAGRCGSEFGEDEMKAFVRYSRSLADGLRTALAELAGCDLRIALTHFSPVPDTLAGEPLEIYPFLGSYLLAEAVDEGRADLAVHGHAHAGTEHGLTAGGVPVRNVAQPVVRHAFALYELHPAEAAGC